MKRTQRHHLKENELALTVARTRDTFERHRRTITIATVAILVITVALGGYWIWRERANQQAGDALASAMIILEAPVVPAADATPAADGTTPAPPPAAPGTFTTEKARLEAALPKLTAAADAHPSTAAGIAARYHAAATLALLGRHTEAEQRYKEVIERDSKGLYGNMARLGLAEVQARAGNYDSAITAWRDLTTRTDAEIPVDGALMQLGRTYVMAGRTADAVQTFTRIVDEFPESVYAQTARQELDSLEAPAPQ